MKKYQKEIIGIYLIFIAFFILLSLVSYDIIDSKNLMGPIGFYIANKLVFYLGLSSYAFPLFLSIYGFIYFTSRDIKSRYYLNFCTYILSCFIWICMCLAFFSTIYDLTLYKHFSGLFSLLFVSLFISKLGYFTTFIILLLYIIISSMIYFNFSLEEFLLKIKDSFSNLMLTLKDKARFSVFKHNDEIKINNYDDSEITSENIAIEEKEKVLNGDSSPDQDMEEQKNYLSDKEDIVVDSNIEIEEEVTEEDVNIDLEEDRKKKYFKYNLPSVDLLVTPIEINSNYTQEELHQKSEELIYALETFGVMGKVKRINQGPVITLFEVEPEEGVRVNKFVNLSDDLSRVMKASKVRVIAPIPGTRFVGIEVPNESPSIVYLKNIINSESYKNLKSIMTIALGKTTSGMSFSFELDKMPHLLVAGATGSGKSVCINSIIASILYKAKPDDVKFILIDPKKVELSSYNMLKEHHIISSPIIDEDVITKTKNSISALESAITEMERRFELFSEVKVRNIQEYNKKRLSNSSLEKIPYIIIIIDELADLMMTSGRSIEDPITRLAQKARAIGIHLIVATQRPSVDVITGLIKSNFPARIAFQVSSKIDSRTIIDQNGAETLLGNGDMLFLPPGSSSPIRLHGALITLEEIESIIEHISNEPTPEKIYLPEVKDSSDSIEFNVNDRDDLLLDAAKLVVQYQQASVSLLQRKFRIGYSRAGRIIDELESLGIVSGYSGSKARDVLVDEEYLDEIVK